MEGKSIVIVSNSRKGENLFHCWDAGNSFFVHTGRGKRGIDNAYSQLRKLYPKITMSITHAAHKNRIIGYYN